MNALQNGSRFSLLPVEQFAQEMNRFLGSTPESDKFPQGSIHTPASIWENDTHYFLEIDLPGVSAEGLELKVMDNNLMVRAERTTSKEWTENQGKFLRQERLFGRFERSFQLPAKIHDTDVDACLSEGVLKVSLAKAPESQVRKIEIRSL